MILLVDSEGSDQTTWMRSLIWAFAVGICPKVFLHSPAHVLFQIVYICFCFSLIRLELCHTYVHYYTELDSVILYGYTKKKSWKRHESDIGMVEYEAKLGQISAIF